MKLDEMVRHEEAYKWIHLSFESTGKSLLWRSVDRMITLRWIVN
jgi:hypothetical protein